MERRPEPGPRRLGARRLSWIAPIPRYSHGATWRLPLGRRVVRTLRQGTDPSARIHVYRKFGRRPERIPWGSDCAAREGEEQGKIGRDVTAQSWA